MVENKKELREKLAKLKNQIKANSKDAHWMDNALMDFEILVGKIKNEPIALDCGTTVDEWKGDTFRITKTTTGVLYHTYGGYSVFCTPEIQSLYGTLADYVEQKHIYEKLDGQEKENVELVLSALSYCLSLPSFVCGDANFLFNIAGYIVKYINDTFDNAMNAELKEETEEDIKKNIAFKSAIIEGENLFEQLREELDNTPE